MKSFKSKEMEILYERIIEKYNVLQLDIHRKKLENLLSEVVLPDTPDGEYEIFTQRLHVFHVVDIFITWNIEKIINSQPDKTTLVKYPVWKIRQLIDLDLNDRLVKEVLEENKRGEGSSRRCNYIVLGELIGLPGYKLIDGNHKFLEKINNPMDLIECYIISGRDVLKFLEPNSRRFMKALIYADNVIKQERSLSA